MFAKDLLPAKDASFLPRWKKSDSVFTDDFFQSAFSLRFWVSKLFFGTARPLLNGVGSCLMRGGGESRGGGPQRASQD
jgi:hypothetical protein